MAFVVAAVFGRLFDDFDVPGVGISYGQFLVMGAVAVLLAEVALSRHPAGEWRVAMLLLAGYCVLGLLSIVYARDTAAVTDELIDIVQNSLVFVVIVGAATTPSRLRGVIWGVVLASGILAAVNLYQLATGSFDQTFWGLAGGERELLGDDRSSFRISGPGLGPNGLAHILTFAIPLALDRSLGETRWRLRVVAAGITVLLVVATMFTYSRNGFLTMMLLGVLITAYRRVPIKRALGIGAVAVVALAMFAPGAYTERLDTLTRLGSDLGTTQSRSVGRTSEYVAGVQMYVDHPVLGVGLGNYPSRYLEYSEQIGLDTRREDRAPHSLYLQFASELGAIGLAWLGIVIAVAIVGLRRSRRAAAEHGDRASAATLGAIEIAFIGFLAFSLFRHIALHRYFFIPIALALAAPGALRPRPATRSTGHQAV